MNFSDKTVSINLKEPISGKDLADNLENAGKALGYETTRISDFKFDQQSASKKENLVKIAMNLLLKKTRWSKTYLCFHTQEILLDNPSMISVNLEIAIQKTLSNTVSAFFFVLIFPALAAIFTPFFLKLSPLLIIFGFVALIGLLIISVHDNKTSYLDINDKKFKEVEPYLIALLTKVGE